MTSPLDNFEAFGFADDFYELGNEANPDATTTLLSLPVELLLEITQYSRFSDIYSLTTVNKILHAVSIKRFYSLVAINATKFLARLAASAGITSDSSISDMIPFFTCKYSGILRGLFARDQHLQSLRSLILCNSPLQSKTEFKILSTIMKYIVNNATALNFMRLPVAHYWPTKHLAAIPVELTGVTYASTLYSLSILELSPATSDAIVRHMSSLKELHTTTITLSFLAMSKPGEVYNRIVKFSCTWVLDAEPEQLDENSALHEGLPQIMPNLQHLSVEYTSWEYQLRHHHTLLTKVSPYSAHWCACYIVFDILKFAHQQILESCYPLVHKLQKLKHFEMPKFTEATYDWRGSEVLNDEAQMLRRFASLGPSLDRVTIRNHNPLALFNIRYTRETSVMWKRTLKEEDGREDSLPVVTWTPDPVAVSRWWWWFGVFGDAIVIRRTMIRHWKGESDIPTLEALKQWGSTNQRMINENLHVYRTLGPDDSTYYI
jgi:hypothetical protein